MFIDIKSQLDNPIVRQIMSACVYKNSLDAAINKLVQYLNHPTWSMYGWLENGEIIGICGFEVHQTNRVDILHIAVSGDARKRGIGSAMLTALQELFCLPLKAETDDDAVEFYRKIGFETTAFQKTKGTCSFRRWVCVLDSPVHKLT